MMSSPISLETVEAELKNVGDGIRQLKMDLEAANDNSSKEKLQNRIQEDVAHLNELKERHCEFVLSEIDRLSNDNNSSPETSERIQILINLLPSKIAKDVRKKRKQKDKKQKAAKERQFDIRKGIEDVKCQRKIYHLLAHEGEGDTFRYFRRLNPNGDICEGDRVYLTEKIDGTTMQATKNGVYKRFDRKGARQSGKWHRLSEDERYSLERLDLENRSNQYVAQAVSPYLERFAELPDGVCIYFEAIGPRIGARFTNIELSNTIQVFDSSENGEFVPFEKTVDLCKNVRLPFAAYSTADLDISDILDRLSKKPSYSEFATPLEGFVVRPTGSSAAAKIRVDDLPSITREQL